MLILTPKARLTRRTFTDEKADEAVEGASVFSFRQTYL